MSYVWVVFFHLMSGRFSGPICCPISGRRPKTEFRAGSLECKDRMGGDLNSFV